MFPLGVWARTAVDAEALEAPKAPSSTADVAMILVMCIGQLPAKAAVRE
jgi:hypothetical protein